MGQICSVEIDSVQCLPTQVEITQTHQDNSVRITCTLSQESPYPLPDACNLRPFDLSHFLGNPRARIHAAQQRFLSVSCVAHHFAVCCKSSLVHRHSLPQHRADEVREHLLPFRDSLCGSQ